MQWVVYVTSREQESKKCTMSFVLLQLLHKRITSFGKILSNLNLVGKGL